MGKAVELKRLPRLLVPAPERVDVPCFPTTGRRLGQMKAIFHEMGSLNLNMGGGKEERLLDCLRQALSSHCAAALK